MRAVRMLARSDLGRRWRSVIVLTLLVAFSGAVVLALFAGARRTESSLARFERESRASNVEVDAGDTTPAQLAEFRRAPGVAAVGQLQQLTLVSPSGQFLPAAAQVDARFGRDVDRSRVIAGRVADLRAVDELNIGEGLAQQLHLKVGDRLPFDSYSPADLMSPEQVLRPHGPHVTFRIVGIVRRPLDLGGRGAAGGVIVPTPAFLARYGPEIGSFSGAVLRVRTQHGAADIARVSRAARRIFGKSQSFSFTSLSIEGQTAQNAIDVTTVGLYVAAGVALLTAFIGIGIALSREIALGDAHQLTLSALGVRPRHRVAAAAAIAVPIATVGAGLALLGAILASPIFPLGVAAKAEPDPGIRIDAVTIGLGFLAVVVVVLLIALAAGMRTARATRPEREASAPGVAARVTEQAGTPPSIAVGVRFALDRGRQRHALPVRSSLFGAAFGVAVVVAVLVFSAGLHHLASTPADFGWTWDLTAYDATAVPKNGDCSAITTRFTRLAGIADVSSVCNGSVEVAGRPVTGWGFYTIRGHIGPAIVTGRAPRADDEVALGADTLAAVHRSVGDRVRVAGGSGSKTFRIVGQAAFASLSDPEPLADGAAFTANALNRLGGNGGWNLVVRLAPGANRALLARKVAPPEGIGGDVLFMVPAEIDRVRQIRGLPVALAGFVAVVALVAVGLALVASVRRRRRELAVLKTLGFTRRQLRTTVAWQASTVAAVGLVIGIPIGLLAGSFVWRRVAGELGVSARTTWPVVGIALLAFGALLAVNLIAAVPAGRAARTRPAVVLRSE